MRRSENRGRLGTLSAYLVFEANSSYIRCMEDAKDRDFVAAIYRGLLRRTDRDRERGGALEKACIAQNAISAQHSHVSNADGAGSVPALRAAWGQGCAPSHEHMLFDNQCTLRLADLLGRRSSDVCHRVVEHASACAQTHACKHKRTFLMWHASKRRALPSQCSQRHEKETCRGFRNV